MAEIFNKNVEIQGTTKLNTQNAQGDLLTIDAVTGIVTSRTTSQLLVDIGISTYTHDQGIPSATWTVVHNLGKYPAVSVVDTGGTVVVGEITYISNNEIEILFQAAFGGKAYLN
jgi:hypothetical protein|tara:strand:- start:307 stop:648 length:342 start_codon:yes stop_codon:yes gene_type:complete